MTQTWEEVFRQWASPPSQTEITKIENAEKSIKNALQASQSLSKRNIKIATQGSYRNKTNVKQDSDIDMSVCFCDSFFPDYPKNMGDSNFGNEPANYPYATFKHEVHQALVSYFGAASVHRGNKAITIRENSYHVTADVAAFFGHRRYSNNGDYEEGYRLITDNGGTITNWHDQHYENGNNKNTATKRRYRGVVRIVKALRNYMEEKNVAAANGIPGFLIECLVWNAPDKSFGHTAYGTDVRETLAHLFNNTLSLEKCKEWGEVSELKYLFYGNKWTQKTVHSFISAAWNFLGLE